MKRICLLACAMGLAGVSRATLHYEVSAQAGQHLHVTVTYTPQASGDTFHMPNWGPGGYMLRTGSGNKVSNVTAHDASGGTLNVSAGDNSWKVPSGNGAVTLSYELSDTPDANGIHWGGPSTYLYPEGRTQEASDLKIDLPKDWKAELGIAPNSKGIYEARTYDVLADNPVTAGVFETDRFRVAGTDYVIAYRGNKDAIAALDRPFLIDTCRQVAQTQTQFFGGSPNKKYVFHFSVFPAPDGGGGLEHLSSTQISLSSGLGKGLVSVISHEHFHLWNVKRIRSSVLGPFDYTKLPKTGALWWLEGVTDYYAHVLLRRSGQYTDNDLYAQLIRNYNEVENNPAHLTVSPYESSMRVDEENGGRGNSNGYKISYYRLGLLAGFVLDAELRATTNGKVTLDTIERDLYAQCKDWQPGFPEDGIRKTLVKYGGEHMGQFYDQVIMKPGELPMSQALAHMGLELKTIPDTNPVLGLAGAVVPGTGLVVDKVPVGTTTVAPKDVIVAVGGRSITGPIHRQDLANFNGAWKTKQPGDIVSLDVKTGDQMRTVLWKLQSPATGATTKVIVERADATPEQKALRAAWLKG